MPFRKPAVDEETPYAAALEDTYQHAGEQQQEPPTSNTNEERDDGRFSCCRSNKSALNPENPAPLPPLTPSEERTYARLQKIQWWMDESVTICGRHVGLDPIVGLLPFVGDFASAFVSLVLVARAAPELNRYTVVRMLTNVWIDAVTGTVPLVGDLFDVGWKANQRNEAIFEDQMKQGKQARRDTDRKWLITVVVCFFLFCFLCTMATIALTVVLVLYVIRVMANDDD